GPIDVAIPVEPATEPRAGEFGRVEVDVGFGEPRWQRLRIERAIEEAAAAWNHADEPIATECELAPRRIARRRIENTADGRAQVALQLLLRNAGRLEIRLVEDRVVGRRIQRRRPGRTTGNERHAEANNGAEAIGTQQCRVPRHWPTPIVADDHRGFLAQRVE